MKNGTNPVRRDLISFVCKALWNPASKNVEPVITDKRLLWPDTLSWGQNGDLYATASKIENMPRFNGGKSTRTEPYRLWKVTRISAKEYPTTR